MGYKEEFELRDKCYFLLKEDYQTPALEKAKFIHAAIIQLKDDDEVAHALEDELREFALDCVLFDVDDYEEIVKIAKSTGSIEFSRWCA